MLASFLILKSEKAATALVIRSSVTRALLRVFLLLLLLLLLSINFELFINKKFSEVLITSAPGYSDSQSLAVSSIY
jgi:hypothetical protein